MSQKIILIVKDNVSQKFKTFLDIEEDLTDIRNMSCSIERLIQGNNDLQNNMTHETSRINQNLDFRRRLNKMANGNKPKLVRKHIKRARIDK